MKKENIIKKTLENFDKYVAKERKNYGLSEDIFPPKFRKILWADEKLSKIKDIMLPPYQIRFSSIKTETSFMSILNELLLSYFPEKNMSLLVMKNRCNWGSSRRVIVRTSDIIFERNELVKLRELLENSIELFFEKYENRQPYFKISFSIEEQSFNFYCFQNTQVFLEGKDISKDIITKFFFTDLTAGSLKHIVSNMYKYALKERP